MTACPFCQKMKSSWNSFKIKEQLKHPSLNILDVNQAVIPSLINSHPTLKSKVANTFSFPDVKMYNEGHIYKYNGDRSETSFQDLVSNVFSKSSEKVSKSSRKSSKSSETASKPSRKSSKSSETASKPSRKSSKSSEKSSKSSEKSSKSSEKSSKSSETASKPSRKSSKRSE
jgi:hypothetical protein